ncbi:MAG: hypothetical protein J6Y28_04865 [Acholeplasmatales bacterium]|nr:hypothetical protein [Methanobrevibacter sp.]MBP5445487.1 hypothetical protein [Acholeplasmatales bacterium]
MKFYSEKLEKFFDSEAECKDAEKEYLNKTTLPSMPYQECDTTISDKSDVKDRKYYAKLVEEADKALEEEYIKYEEAKKQIIQLKKKCDEECEKILVEAKKELKAVQDKKFVALQNFNEKFGPYTISYTGDKALKEMRRHFDTNVDLFHWFFPFFNW